MMWKLVGYVKVAATFLMIEMLLPGGTLLVLALLFSGRLSPAMSRRLRPVLTRLGIRDAAADRTIQSSRLTLHPTPSLSRRSH